MSFRRSRRSQNGLAIAMVMFFVIIILTFFYTMIFSRAERTRQTKLSFQYLRAHYLAQGAIQHALLKIRMLPNECFYASCLQKGICPFDPLLSGTPAVGTKFDDDTSSPIAMFKQDVSSTDFPIRSTGFDYSQWHYEIPSLRAVTIFRRQGSSAGTAATVHVLEILARATIEDKLYHATATDSGQRTEMVKKVVEIERF